MRIQFEITRDKPPSVAETAAAENIPARTDEPDRSLWWAIATVLLVFVQIYPPAWQWILSLKNWQSSPINSADFYFPIKGYTISTATITDRPGSPRDGGKRTHAGIDLVVPNGKTVGAEVLSVMSGVVTEVRPCLRINAKAWNYCIGIESKYQDKHYKHRYVHVNDVMVALQQRVKAGETIAKIGPKAVASTGPPLHFELYADGKLDWHPDKTLKKAAKLE